MKAPLRFSTLCAAIAVGSMVSTASAEEKNGMRIDVVKKTLDRNDARNTYYAYNRIDRTQGLKVTIKNIAFRPMPEGEVEWTILVRKWDSSTPKGYTGVEKLKALKTAEEAVLLLGAAQITGWRDWYDYAKDKMEYRVIVRHDGKETIRTASSPAFDSVASHASISRINSNAGAAPR